MKTIIISLLLIGLITSPPVVGSTFTLSFDYAARQGVDFQSCLADVIWDNDIVFSVVPTDYDIHNVTVEVTAVVGGNVIQFEGAGASDSVGLGITNVALIQQGDTTNTNVLVNGDFSQPNLGGGWATYNSIPGWTALNLEMGAGPIYNSAWSNSTQIIELDSVVNFEITQDLTFDSNFAVIANSTSPPACPTSALFPPANYTLQFDWAPNTVGTANLLTSQANILWNNVVLDSLVPTNITQGVNHASYQVTPNSCGQNYLQFDGTQESDGFGMVISNVQLTLTSTSPNLLSDVWTAANPEFSDCSSFNIDWSAGQSCFSLDSGTNQRYTQTVIILFPVQKSFDIVGPLTKTAFGCLVQQGYTYVSIRADSDTPGVIDPNAIQTLQNAQASGLTTAIYMVLCPGFDPMAQLLPVLQGISSILYHSIWFKITQNSSPQCKWQNYNDTYNCQFLSEILFITYESGFRSGVFSTKAIWNRNFGNVCPFGSVNYFYLWYADYQANGILDPTESFSDFTTFTGFGGWIQPDLKQVVGNIKVTNLCNNPSWHARISIDWHP